MKKTKTKSFLQTVIIFLCTCLFFLTGCASNKIFYIETENGNFYNHLVYKYKNYEVYIVSNSNTIILEDIELKNFQYHTYYSCQDQRNPITEGNKTKFKANSKELSLLNFNETTIQELEIIEKTHSPYASTPYAYSNKYNSYIYGRACYTLKEEKKVKIKSNSDTYTITYYNTGYNSGSCIAVEQYEWRTHTIEIPKEKLKAIYYYSK